MFFLAESSQTALLNPVQKARISALNRQGDDAGAVVAMELFNPCTELLSPFPGGFQNQYRFVFAAEFSVPVENGCDPIENIGAGGKFFSHDGFGDFSGLFARRRSHVDQFCFHLSLFSPVEGSGVTRHALESKIASAVGGPHEPEG